MIYYHLFRFHIPLERYIIEYLVLIYHVCDIQNPNMGPIEKAYKT